MSMYPPERGVVVTVALTHESNWLPNAEVLNSGVYTPGDPWTLRCSDGVVRHVNPAHIVSWRDGDGTEAR